MNSRTIGICGLLAALTAVPAFADDFSYADPYGNLVVESDAGYKRIIVGQGHNARKLADYLDAGREETAYLSGGDRAFADSQGNITIRTAAGYKRIVVGQAEQARAVARELRAGQAAPYGPGPDVFGRAAAQSGPVVCAGENGVIKGRSYMYGLDKDETPVIVSCD